MRPLSQRLLSSRDYDIEFHGFLTNHVKHAIIALDGLQAPSSRIQDYWDTYTTMTPYHIPIERASTSHTTQDETTSSTTSSTFNIEDWNRVRGTKQQFQDQVKFLQQELEQRDGRIDLLLKDFVTPSLLSGWMGALTHTIIHLGWSVDARNDYMILEGLAYLNYAHLGFDDQQLNFGSENNQNSASRDVDLLDSFKRISTTFHNDDEDLATAWIDDAKASFDETTFHPELVEAGFQWQVAKVVAKPNKVATDIPQWIQTMPSLTQLMEMLWKTVTLVFLATRTTTTTTTANGTNGTHTKKNSNFIVLHLLSSLWGLEKLLQVLEDESLSRHALSHYYAGMVVFVSMLGFPSLTAESLSEIASQYPFDNNSRDDDGDDDDDNNDTGDWTSIVEAGVQEEEEHNIKLVYMCKSLWERYDHWPGFREAATSFTITPTITTSTGFNNDKEESK